MKVIYRSATQLKVREMCAQMTHKLVMLVAKKVNTDEPSAACSDWQNDANWNDMLTLQ